jgi:hypothetical protein
MDLELCRERDAHRYTRCSLRPKLGSNGYRSLRRRRTLASEVIKESTTSFGPLSKPKQKIVCAKIIRPVMLGHVFKVGLRLPKLFVYCMTKPTAFQARYSELCCIVKVSLSATWRRVSQESASPAQCQSDDRPDVPVYQGCFEIEREVSV